MGQVVCTSRPKGHNEELPADLCGDPPTLGEPDVAGRTITRWAPGQRQLSDDLPESRHQQALAHHVAVTEVNQAPLLDVTVGPKRTSRHLGPQLVLSASGTRTAPPVPRDHRRRRNPIPTDQGDLHLQQPVLICVVKADRPGS